MGRRVAVYAIVIVGLVVAVAVVALRRNLPALDAVPDCPWTSTQFEWDYRNRIREGMSLAEVEAVLGSGKRVPSGISQWHGRYQDGSGRWKHITIEGDTEFYSWRQERRLSLWSQPSVLNMTVCVGFYEGGATHWWFDDWTK
jgi:hypothetical protein